MTEDRVPTDYERGNRSRAAVAVQIDHVLDRLLRDNADREQLWPLIYEYGAASAQPAPLLDRTTVQNALDEAWLESHDARDIPRPPDLGEHLYEALTDYVAIARQR